MSISGSGAPNAEAELVRRAQDGCSTSFGELVRSYQRRAVSVGYRLLGNTDDACDVAQEAFVRAYRNLQQLDDPCRFGAWFLRTVTNLALNFRRSRGGRAAASLDKPSDTHSEWRNPATGRTLVRRPEDDENGPLPAEMQSAVSDAIATLPDKQRLALILFSIEGMRQKEVAEILECSVELVKWNVFQARQKLKMLLEEFL